MFTSVGDSGSLRLFETNNFEGLSSSATLIALRVLCWVVYIFAYFFGVVRSARSTITRFASGSPVPLA